MINERTERSCTLSLLSLLFFRHFAVQFYTQTRIDCRGWANTLTIIEARPMRERLKGKLLCITRRPMRARHAVLYWQSADTSSGVIIGFHKGIMLHKLRVLEHNENRSLARGFCCAGEVTTRRLLLAFMHAARRKIKFSFLRNFKYLPHGNFYRSAIVGGKRKQSYEISR